MKYLDIVNGYSLGYAPEKIGFVDWVYFPAREVWIGLLSSQWGGSPNYSIGV